MYNRQSPDKRVVIKERRFLFPLFIIAGILLLGLLVMWLWNAIFPSVLHAGTLNYGQALGLLLLCRILFGGFKGRPGNNRWRGGPQWRQKWMQMSDEEKARFKEEWRKRCNPGSQ